MDADRYLDRIGLTGSTPAAVSPDRKTLSRLASAHIRTVPFENLAIVGDPHGPRGGDGVSLQLEGLYEKIVERRRGGFCFEINGLFNWLLGELGYDVDRCAARIGGDENSLGNPPANHHTNVVHLDRRYVADIGTGTPQMREPVPLDGTVVADDAGVEWRVDPAEMPLSDYAVWIREPGEEWRLRYRFRTEPRDLSFFQATCEYLANEPDGTFTSGPIIRRSTGDGALHLDADTLTRTAEGETATTPVPPEHWHDVLEREFDITL